MTKEKFREILKQRLAKRLQTQSFDELTVHGSQMRFEMALAINGYPFELPKGANKKDYESILTDEQYQSGEFDDVIDEVFLEALENS